MMRKFVLWVGMFFMALAAQAGSEVPYPADWSNWQAVDTQLSGIGA